MKFMWVYPRTMINKLEFCYIFHGTEREFRKWLKKIHKDPDKAVKMSAKFAKC